MRQVLRGVWVVVAGSIGLVLFLVGGVLFVPGILLVSGGWALSKSAMLAFDAALDAVEAAGREGQ